MIPARRLILLAILPLCVGATAVMEPQLTRAMLAIDAVVLLAVLLDAAFGLGRPVEVKRRAPGVMSVGRWNVVTLELRSRSRRAQPVSVAQDLPDVFESEGLPATVVIPPGGMVTVRYRVRPLRRGAAQLGAHHVRHPTPLGLLLRRYAIADQHEVRVYPDLLAVRTFELLARADREQALWRTVRQLGGDSEFERMREYGRDDEFRDIDWRATARRGKLIVRSYQAERNQNVVLALDCGRLMTAERDGLSLFDHALNATVMLAHVAARQDDHLGLLAFGAEVRRWVPPQPRAAHRVVHASYDLHAELEESDFGAAARAASAFRKRSLLVLFTQVADERGAQALRKMARALQPRHLPLFVMLRDTDLDRLYDAAGDPTTTRGQLYAAAAAAELIGWRNALLRRLRAEGVLVLDVSPERLTPALIERYLEVKAQHLL